MARSNTTLTGAAGEHFVMFQLLRRNYIAGLAPQNAPDIDILVSNRNGTILSTIQVKTAGHRVTDGWQMQQKHEGIVGDRLYYCFVDPGDDRTDLPTCWLVPSRIVADHLATTHPAWLQEGLEKGIRRQDSQRRKLHVICRNPPLPQYQSGWLDRYREAWDQLG